MKFLGASDTMTEIKELLASGSLVKAAVSYWGDGAIDSLCINDSQELTIVCDILSGGCNPVEIRRLIRILGKERVLTYDRLHAKVWLGKNLAIVGSSNASSNGLGFEKAEAASLVEANLVTDSLDVLPMIANWWEEKIRKHAREITESDLRRAQKLRERHRRIRPLDLHGDLLTGLQAQPQSYIDRDLYVWVWKHDDTDAWVDEVLEQAQEQFGKDIECWQDVEDPPPPGSYIVDFNSDSDPPLLVGIYRVLLDQAVYKSTDGTLLLCRKVTNFEGMRLGSKAMWRIAAKAALEATEGDKWEGEANDFARFIPPAPR